MHQEARRNNFTAVNFDHPFFASLKLGFCFAKKFSKRTLEEKLGSAQASRNCMLQYGGLLFDFTLLHGFLGFMWQIVAHQVATTTTGFWPKILII